jgi:hypothetical protein
MKNTKLKFLSVTLLSLVTSAAFANRVDEDYKNKCKGERHCWSAPEIDPAQAMNALALLGGTLAIVRGNRRKKK